MKPISFSIYRLALLAAVLLASGFLAAQPGGNPLGGKDTLMLENERIEDIIDSEKPFQKPPYQEIKPQGQEGIQYSSRDFYVATDFEPGPPDLRLLSRPRAERYTNNFFKLGVGRYITPLAQLHIYNGARSESLYGLDFTHRSAHQDEIPLRRFREDYGTVRLAAIGDEFTLGGRVHFYNTSYFNYADTVFANNAEAREDSLRNGFTQFALVGDIFSNRPEQEGFHYKASAGFRTMGENRGGREWQINLLPSGGYRFSDELSVDLLGDVTVAGGRTDTLIQNRFFTDLSPRVAFNNGSLALTAGVRFAYFANSADDSSLLFLGPVIEASYEIVPDRIVVEAGYISAATPNWYSNLLQENRYLGGAFLLKPTVERAHIYLGARGALGNQIDFSARAYYKRVQDQLIYRTFDDVYFQAVYDSLMTVTGAHVELNYDLNDAIRAGAALNVNVYNTSNQDSLTPKYFHASPFRLDAFFAYTWQKKLTARGELFLYGPAPMSVDNSRSIINRGLYPDINLYADYRLAKSFSVYLAVNNLLNFNYQRWHNYPERRIDFMGGITLSF